ncbi:MAG: class I SAM-dependent methyltransferase [Phycisphaerales bacterium]|nr:class I SAM-dependent methyltransferase [Phycisphaerales bacterium]
MMDVLEHVSDDVGLLREYADRLAGDGRIFITVPAFMFVFSGHDLFLGHYRRYTSSSLERTLRMAGLSPVKIRYYFVSLFPAVAGSRMVKRLFVKNNLMEARSELKLYPKWLNHLLLTIHDLERVSCFPFNHAFGLSLFCLCKKSD